MDEAERQKKLEVGRAKNSSNMPRSQSFASYQKKRAKSNSAGAAKKTQKGKGQVDSKNDGQTQDHRVEPPPPSVDTAALEGKTSSETGGSNSEKSENQQNDQQEDQFSTLEGSLSPLEDLREEELAALTGKEQLKLLQQAVEKRNEIIAKLSHKLQEALSSRDQMQLQAQCLAGQIQGMQKQLQQTTVEFQRIKGQPGAEAFGVAEYHHGLSSQPTNIRHKKATSEGSGNAGHASQQSPEGLNSDSDTEIDKVLHKLMSELEEERKNSQRLSAELAKEMERNRHVLSLLEEEREEERKEREAQLQTLQNQCLVMLQYKEEKEELNREVLELRRRLQNEDSERRSDLDSAGSAFRLQNLEEEKRRLEDEMQTLKEEVEHVRQLLDKSERQLQQREKEVEGLKAFKNRENHAKAAITAEEVTVEEAHLESGADGEDLDASVQGDILMERYLSSVPPAHSQSSMVNEGFEQPSPLDMSADCSFELNSDVFGDQPLLSISYRVCEENKNNHNINSTQYTVSEAGDSSGQFFSRWLPSSGSGEMGSSQLSEQQFEKTDLEKQLLSQQCGELHEELAQKERDMGVLREEVLKSAEELEEARSRWAQVTEELQQALCELEEERERRRLAEEEMNSRTDEQETSDYRDGVLMQGRENETVATSMGQEAGRAAETSLIRFSVSSSENVDEFSGKLNEETEEEVSLLAPQNEEELQATKSSPDSSTDVSKQSDEPQIQTLQAYCDQLKSELEETKMEQKTTTTLFSQKVAELDALSKELEATRSRFLKLLDEVDRLQQELQKSQDGLDSAERAKNELESQIHSLREILACLEEAQALSAKQREEEKRKEQQMDEQIKKMEQVLEEELEQFENIMKAKDLQLAEEKEKWEEERQEKEKLIDATRLLEEKIKEKEEEVKAVVEKQAQAVEEASGKLRASHKQEIRILVEKHQQEISELNDRLETELLKQRVVMEEEQKQQIGLIKEVTEREHERMMSELKAKHNEELEQLRTEVTLELRESMEAAHQAEMHQVQTQKSMELEALRLSLTTAHTSQLETSQANVQQEQESAVEELQAAMREKFTQESALLQARYQSGLDSIKQQNQQQQDRLQELHQQEIDELKQRFETRFAQERAGLEEKQIKEIQALRAQWETEAETTSQRSLSEIQNRLNATQTELVNTQASLAETSRALADTRAALSQSQSDLQEATAALEELQTSRTEQVQKLEEDLKRASADKEAAANSLEMLVCSHERALQEKEQQVRHLQEQEQQLQQEVLHLQEEKALLKKSSEEEVGQLWTQLESMRASRQELGELKEQLIVRSSQVDDIEHLKTEFSEQKREIKELHEVELENLRKYFEKRLHVSEETYKEEIALLQLRLVESALEESVMKTSDDSSMHHILAEEEKDKRDASIAHTELFDNLRVELEEKHAMDLSQLESSLALSYKEELQQVRSDLTDHYYEELQEMKTRHALELEQLRAKLSESHLQDLTRVHLETERQVEVAVEQRMWRLTEELQTGMTIIHTLENNLAALSKHHEADYEEKNPKKRREELQQKHEPEISALKSDLEREKKCLEEALEKEREKLKSLELSLDDDEGPQLLMIKQRLEAQYNNELQKAKSCMAEETEELKVLLQEQSEEKLRLAQQRFDEEKAELEQRLVQSCEKFVAELEDKHKAELEDERSRLLNKHSEEMNALHAKHKAQLDSLGACHRDQLAAMVKELDNKHKAELVALESALDSKRMEDLKKLEAAFKETSQAQLEALEAELAHRHQEERDELEKRMLGNMDTLEATYLKEVQVLRDEMNRLEEKHRQDLISRSSEHKQLMEHQTAEQLSVREELKRELAQVHMDKFKAMAAELNHVHKMELTAQKEMLDTEHCRALEALKQQVLELEQQHGAALQELSHTFSVEKEQLIEQHQSQLQELRGISACELDACRRELEEESARQRQRFQEEVELLKVQSEERLQDKINHLKTEFEERKKVELEDLRRSFTSQQQEKEQIYTSKMSELTTQLQQLEAVVAQLRAEIGCLQDELHGKRTEMETLDTLLQRRERESQEGGNLLKMLTDDLQDAKEEKTKLYGANEKMSKVLVEMLRSVIATEELIGQKINSRIQTNEQTTQKSSKEHRDQESVVDLTSEEMELTQMLCESLLVTDTQISPGGEESALTACSRLRLAVETLLDLLHQAHTQLEQTCHVHLTLEEKFTQGKEDATHLLEQHKLLTMHLDEEAKMKTRLQLELHKAEGLLDGYVAEKATLEESLQQKEAQEEKLVEELEGLKVKLHKMQSLAAELDAVRGKYQELTEEHTILLRQKEHLSAGLGEREKALLAETERLTQDRLDLQRQAEKDHKSLSLRLRNLERELEDQETKLLEKELQHKNHSEDLSQRVQALEKQLKHDRQFIEEQAVEREHERDEFQQEIRRLEAQLRHTGNGDNKAHKFEDLLLQVESLQFMVKDKTDDHASLLEANQQAQRDLAERNEEIDKLAGRIRELEQALLNSAESVRTVNKLEQELHKAKQREQELTQDKLALEQQQLSSRLQISALQSKLDETRHCYHDNTRDPTQELRDALDAAQQNLHCKEQEVEVLLGQLENVQRDLHQKEVELKRLTAQLELLMNKNAAQVEEFQKEIYTLKETMSTLTEVNEEKGQVQVAENEEETLPAALLQEKNQEIDHLNCEIQKLEQELESARDNRVGVLEVELEDLRSQVEHLQSEITRVRQEKQEEEERLHEVISTLQAELATLGPNLHEVSDSQDGDSINPSPSPSPEPHMETLQERRGGPNSLKHEISLTRSAASSSLHSRLKALQSQFETAVAEKEGLERLLLTQEEEYRTQGEEFVRRLGVEREKFDEVQGLLRLKETELEEEKEKRKLSEEERDGLKVEAEEATAVREEKARLDAIFLDLQNNEQERLGEIEALKTNYNKMKLEMEVLREANLTYERQVQEVRAENVEMEKAMAEGSERIKTLETVKGELSAEREALRRRECQLQEEIKTLRKEVGSMNVLIQELTAKLRDQETSQEEAQKEFLTHADVTLAKAEASLRQRKSECEKLKAENEALKTELATVKQGVKISSERTGKPHENGEIKRRHLVDLEAENQRMKAELERLQQDVGVQEEELAYQRRELEQLRRLCQQQETDPHYQDCHIKDVSHRAFEDVLSVSRDEASLSSPEVLRKLECSEDQIRERFHVSVLDSRLSELSGLNCTGQDLPQVKISPGVVMEPPHSRTVTPDPATQSTHSPGSLTASDHFSVLDSLDPDKLDELEELDLTAPPSPLGSTSSFSAQEWNSDGYGSNVSSELGARLRVELEQTERLDAQFVQYLRCRGINPTANTDSAAGSMSYSDDLLSPELQALLKKVYQESCRILTLSQRRCAPSSQANTLDLKTFSPSRTRHCFGDGSAALDCRDNSTPSNPPMNWQQEKRALQETVVALRELLCRMAQRQTQTDYTDDGWHRSHLQSDGDVESQITAELEENQRQLKCAHNSLQEHKNKILSLRLAAEEAEEALRTEQTRFQELQQELAQERALILCKDRERGERMEAVQVSSEKLKSEVMSLKAQVEQEKVACSNLRQELQIEQSRSGLLEKRLQDAQKELEDEHKRFSHQQELLLQEKDQAECLLNEVKSGLAESHCKLADSHRKLEEERQLCSRQIDELSCRHEEDTARDQKFISGLRSQLEQERRQGEDLAAMTDKLRGELLESRRKWEEDRIRLEELQREKEAAAWQRTAMETLKEQNREFSCALEMERQRSRLQDIELEGLKERFNLLKEKERERDAQLEKERRKERQEVLEREMLQDRTNNKVLELELLRQQDQQRMQELQQTLADLERENREREREMAAQKELLHHKVISPQRPISISHTDGAQAGVSLQQQQRVSTSSSNLLQTLLKENSDLTERLSSVSQESATFKSRLAILEKQLQRKQSELAKVTTETENQPVSDPVCHHRLQRYYERYLRAESFRKALVYQKRYLILLLGGFQDCEQATLSLIARMGVRPSSPLTYKRRPIRRFRAVVRVVIAVSRMRFLTRKWQRAVRRVALSGTINGHLTAPKADVLRQQQPKINFYSAQNGDRGDAQRATLSFLAPPGKSTFRLQRRPNSSSRLTSAHSAGTSQDPERSLTDYIHHLERVQQRLVGNRQGSSAFQSHLK
ncbi:A-kinase anchor protein 9-like isoform X1 [Xiphophorus maculatus]|uniref:A-kinase anchor protein 9-like isoform X1 n=1 Tax=Xiphophorus maculatus TaxID=8083 RepID=UPI000C6CBF50|nr:A-kinase anchor protein 9-like isoform X1 [Xiphophorus maculatus]